MNCCCCCILIILSLIVSILYFFPGSRIIFYALWCILLIGLNTYGSYWLKEICYNGTRAVNQKTIRTQIFINAFATIVLPSIINLILMNYYLWITVIFPFHLALFFYTFQDMWADRTADYRLIRNTLTFALFIGIFITMKELFSQIIGKNQILTHNNQNYQNLNFSSNTTLNNEILPLISQTAQNDLSYYKNIADQALTTSFELLGNLFNNTAKLIEYLSSQDTPTNKTVEL